MGFTARGKIWIPEEEWTRFVLQFVSTGPAEVSLGPPKIEQGMDLVVPYAANTECHPSEETVPPEWCNPSSGREHKFEKWLADYDLPVNLSNENM